VSDREELLCMAFSRLSTSELSRTWGVCCLADCDAELPCEGSMATNGFIEEERY
jgi:hypothetical protein